MQEERYKWLNMSEIKFFLPTKYFSTYKINKMNTLCVSLSSQKDIILLK